jgi:hypothetical protein
LTSAEQRERRTDGLRRHAADVVPLPVLESDHLVVVMKRVDGEASLLLFFFFCFFVRTKLSLLRRSV